MNRAWALLAVDDGERSYMGNAGYQDVLGQRYTWDETVANGRQLATGDLVVLCDSDFVLGAAWLDSIDEWPDSKDRYRCPSCTSTKFHSREHIAPRYRCTTCTAAFETPQIEVLENISFFRGDYERTWQELDLSMAKDALGPAFLSQARQNSIRELDFHVTKVIIEQAQSLGELWWASTTTEKKKLPGGFYGVIGKARIGQQRFREEMLLRFGSCCAISGPLPGSMLDAAHLYRYADEPKHDIAGGLLLRRDLHALFDRYELLIDPDDDWRIEVRPSLKAFPEVWRFHGGGLLTAPEVRPKADYLRIHAAATRAKWNAVSIAEAPSL